MAGSGERLPVEEVGVERAEKQQSTSWLSQALHKKRKRSSANRDIPKFVVLDRSLAADPDAPRFDDGTRSFVSLKISPPPERRPNARQEDTQPQVLDGPPADPEGQDANTQAVEETKAANVPPPSPELPEPKERPVLSSLLGQLVLQFDERNHCLEEKIGELDRLVTEGRLDGKEQFERLGVTIDSLQTTLAERVIRLTKTVEELGEQKSPGELPAQQLSREEFTVQLAQIREECATAVTALQHEVKASRTTFVTTVAALQEAVQEMQRSSAATIENLSRQAQAQTEELHALRSAVGGRQTFWSGFLLCLIMAAAVGMLSTLYFTVFAPEPSLFDFGGMFGRH